MNGGDCLPDVLAVACRSTFVCILSVAGAGFLYNKVVVKPLNYADLARCASHLFGLAGRLCDGWTNHKVGPEGRKEEPSTIWAHTRITRGLRLTGITQKSSVATRRTSSSPAGTMLEATLLFRYDGSVASTAASTTCC